METFVQKPYSPWYYSLFILVGLSLACSVVFQLLSILGWLLISGNTNVFLQDVSLIVGSEQTSSGFTYVLLLVGSVGTFLLPAVLLQIIEKRYFHYFPVSSQKTFTFCVLSFLFLLAVNPLMGLIAEWNRGMTLPASMSDIEIWMQEKEEQMASFIKHLVMTTSVWQFVLNIVVFAIVPAICEEFFFRGALQGIAKRWLKSDHAAIWVTAVIFSAIHFQFYGFFPRVLLGAMFGYMMVWSGNIWVPVFAHFLNNASVTVMAFIFAIQGKTYEEMTSAGDGYHTGLYLLSMVGSLAIGYYFYKNRLTKERGKIWKTAG